MAKLLLLDDDPLVLTTTAMMLEDQGHKVVSVAVGNDATLDNLKDIAQREKPDALVTDFNFNMKRFNGIDAIEAIRQSPIREVSQLPAMVFTANPSGASQALEQKSQNGVKICNKPNFDSLFESLDKLFARGKEV